MTKEEVLAQQLQTLSGSADDPHTQWAVQVMGRVLLSVAQQLGHTHYWLVGSKEGYWQTVHLQNVHAPEQTKTVIYAFADVTSANLERLQSDRPEHLLCLETPILDILFRALALQQVESIIFFDQPFHTHRGTEIKRSSLERMCQAQLAKHRPQIV